MQLVIFLLRELLVIVKLILKLATKKITTGGSLTNSHGGTLHWAGIKHKAGLIKRSKIFPNYPEDNYKVRR